MAASKDNLERWRGAVDAKLDTLKETVESGVGRIEKAIEAHVHRDEEIQDDLCERVTKLETKESGMSVKVAGLVALISILGGAIAAAVAKAYIG